MGNAGIKEWDLVTKLPEVPKLCTNISDWVNDQITGSLKRLRVDRVKALMLHRPEQLLGTDGGDLWHAIKELKNRGIVKKIGFSIYGPEELEQLWMRYRPDIIQAPFNIFDQRLKTSGWLEKLHNNNVEIHVRSIFLQGLLLMNKDDRPEEFNLKLWPKGRNREETIHRSKAVGEPPLMLAISVHHAIAEAVGCVGAPGHIVALDAPATPECVLDAVDRARASMTSGEKPS